MKRDGKRRDQWRREVRRAEEEDKKNRNRRREKNRIRDKSCTGQKCVE